MRAMPQRLFLASFLVILSGHPFLVILSGHPFWSSFLVIFSGQLLSMRTMSLSFSVADHSSLFGVGFDANTHLERLRAADSFYRIRKDIEKHRTSLALITPKEFKKKYSTFRARLEDVIKEGPQTGRRKLLKPLLENLTTDGIWDFVLVCVTLSDDQCNTLENASFADIFPLLVKGVAGIVTVPSETTTAILTIINKVCVQIDSPLSNQLLGQFVVKIVDKANIYRYHGKYPSRTFHHDISRSRVSRITQPGQHEKSPSHCARIRRSRSRIPRNCATRTEVTRDRGGRGNRSQGTTSRPEA
jgi:hypothetical protein